MQLTSYYIYCHSFSGGCYGMTIIHISIVIQNIDGIIL